MSICTTIYNHTKTINSIPLSLTQLAYGCLLMAIVAVVHCAPVDETTTETLKQESDNNPDGSYAYAYETSNGISAQESGLGGERAVGGYKWISPEGETIDIQYVADAEGGYRATGAAIPVAPETPAHVLRLVEYLAAHPNDDDGSYKP